MFCFKCGHQIPDDAQFCSKCGTQQKSAVSQKGNFGCSDNVSSLEFEGEANNSISNSSIQKDKYKKSVVGIGVAVSVVLVIGIVFSIFANVIPKRVNFELKFDQDEIQDFLKVVYKNADVESVQLEEIGVGGDTFTYGDFISAKLTVKPHGMKEEEIEVRFYNSDDTDAVAGIVIYYHDHDSENEAMCRDAIIEALEISFCGTSKAKEYTSGFSSMGTEPATYDTKLVTDYSLTDDANVRITWKEWSGSPMFEWTGTYCIYRN